MTNKVMKIVGTTALSISLLTGAASAVSANDATASKVGNEVVEITPFAVGDTLTWDLKGTKEDPENDFNVSVGYPNIKLYAKNTGSASFRVEVMHNSKKTVIFNSTVAPGKTVEVVNNDSNPKVPSGTYTVTVYGGSGLPKGEVVLKSSNTKW
ncbi:hypothetical protein OIN60_21680 [Paenibacillus sp. P96]|uniref:Uncharacterized protein n=1 Tax=Paenibacillus zeirhizosphaerae TaxID=2987519 RepID=A0ABT9FX70_9BACL|nr:hypothetical protein [Paenibacillus sp. P96]MDP4099331.1 hypothetical protein [Paenibacillus sp. P96]